MRLGSTARRLRLAALGLHHESNTFVTTKTDLDAFRTSGVFRGSDIRTRYANSEASMAGFLDLETANVEVEPLLFTFPNPGGPITTEAFEVLCGEMMKLLQENGPWDAVLMAQHGAAVCEAYPDADAEIVNRARQVVGPRTPIGVALDLHANLSQRLLENATVTVAYRTNPHRDARARAKECGELIAATARQTIHPVQALVRIAAVPSILCQGTDSEPLLHVYAGIEAALALPGMLSASICEGYPYADVADMGMACIAIHDGKPEAALSAARDLGSMAWEAREGLVGRADSPSHAIRRASEAKTGPVVLLDVGDNVGAGSAGDSTVLLGLAIKNGISSFLQSLCDREAVTACMEPSTTDQIELTLGNKSADAPSRPLRVTGQVLARHSGPFEDPTPTHGGFTHFDPGPSVAFRCDSGQTLVLHSKLMQNISLVEYSVLGLDPRRYKVVVAKGVNAPRLAYAAIANEFIVVDTPGPTSSDLSQLSYAHRPVPMFPFERNIQKPMSQWYTGLVDSSRISTFLQEGHGG